MFTVVGICLCMGGLYYLNKIGLTDDLRSRVSLELEKSGIYAEFSSLKLDLVRGVIAEDVTLFPSVETVDPIASFGQVVINVDKTKALRGIIRIERIHLKEGALSVPLTEKANDEILPIENINGKIRLFNKRSWNIQELSGNIAGIDLQIKGLLKLPKEKTDESSTPDTTLTQLAYQITHELAEWDFSGSTNPLLRINFDGQIDKPQLVTADFQLDVPLLKKNNYAVSHLTVKGSLDGKQVTINDFKMTDSSGNLACSGHYDLSTQEGALNLNSSLHVQNMIYYIFGKKVAPNLLIEGSSQLQGDAVFSLTEGKPEIQVTGSTSAKDVTFRGLTFSSARGEFSWKDGDFFVRKMFCSNPRGDLSGRLLIKNNQLKYRIDCSLPIDFFRSSFQNDIVQKIVDRFKFTSTTHSLIQAEGQHSLVDPTVFDLVGNIDLSSFTYRNIPVNQVKTDFIVDQNAVDLRKIHLDLDFTESKWKKTYGGPSSGIILGERVLIDLNENLIKITQARGQAWPQLAVGLFSPKTNRFIDPYRFHSPPQMVGNGNFDMERPPKRTDFSVSATIPGRTDYDFIGKALPLKNVKTSLRFRYRKTDILPSTATLFGGPVRVNISIVSPERDAPQISGHADWTQLEMKQLAKNYGIKSIKSGSITGRFDFSLLGGDVKTLRGIGNIGLQNTNLFAVPVFGPLSPLMSGLLQDKRAGYERAKNASLTFTTKKGIMYFDDFSASTRSLVFTGDGEVNLQQKAIRMTIRMNGKGLLRILNIPLAPLIGLFQFTGSGPLSKPTWKNTPFTRPPARENAVLMREPPKAEIVEEPR